MRIEPFTIDPSSAVGSLDAQDSSVVPVTGRFVIGAMLITQDPKMFRLIFEAPMPDSNYRVLSTDPAVGFRELGPPMNGNFATHTQYFCDILSPSDLSTPFSGVIVGGFDGSDMDLLFETLLAKVYDA